MIDDAVERQGRGRKLELALQVQNFLTIPIVLDQMTGTSATRAR